MNYTKSVEKWDVFEFSAEGTTAGRKVVEIWIPLSHFHVFIDFFTEM